MAGTKLPDQPILRIGLEIEALFDPQPRIKHELQGDFVDKLIAGCSDMYSALSGGRQFNNTKWAIDWDQSLRGYDKRGPCKSPPPRLCPI